MGRAVNGDIAGALVVLCVCVLWAGVAYVRGDFEDADQ